ncbi:homeobox protein ceh-1-like [Bradysia coprophila]|uniref:homeobox protein ceh-1-like n=1 Tax=Bradysia coprophila TaxID=38358 RepID=UPI00187DBF0A|nr:homeobox protein ceh-1-like [Bradysia coprophila]
MDLFQEEELSIPNFDLLMSSPSSSSSSQNGETRTRKPRNKDGPKRARTAYSVEQISQLEMSFKQNAYLTRIVRLQLSEQLGLPEATIKVWFQNRRMKDKLEKRAQRTQISSTSPTPATSTSSSPQTSIPNTPVNSFYDESMDSYLGFDLGNTNDNVFSNLWQ